MPRSVLKDRVATRAGAGPPSELPFRHLGKRLYASREVLSTYKHAGRWTRVQRPAQFTCRGSDQGAHTKR